MSGEEVYSHMDEWVTTVYRLLYDLTSDVNIKTGKEADFLKSYYKDFFPFEDICAWLCYGKFDNFHCREFAYTLLSEVFVRNKSFEYFREMKFEICKVCPAKIDIGALFNIRPARADYGTSIRRPVEKELTLDIDLSDYNNVRTCCKDTTICQKCWKFIAVACKILDVSLREDFGWQHILWVFSGRRGIHCWICDPTVRRMNNKQRKQIIMYYTLRKPSVNTKAPINLGNNPSTHAHITRSYKIASQEFLSICINEQDILGTPEGVIQFISLLPTDSCQQNVTQLFKQCSTSNERWDNFSRYWKSEKQLVTSLWKSRPHLMKEIILYYLYPRIDTAVTVGMNHLLKAPFSFHPKTFLLCTPFDPKKVDEFIIPEVPYLYKFIEAVEDRRTGRDGTLAEHIQVQRYQESLCIFKNFVKSVREPLDSFHD